MLQGDTKKCENMTGAFAVTLLSEEENDGVQPE